MKDRKIYNELVQMEYLEEDSPLANKVNEKKGLVYLNFKGNPDLEEVFNDPYEYPNS